MDKYYKLKQNDQQTFTKLFNHCCLPVLGTSRTVIFYLFLVTITSQTCLRKIPKTWIINLKFNPSTLHPNLDKKTFLNVKNPRIITQTTIKSIQQRKSRSKSMGSNSLKSIIKSKKNNQYRNHIKRYCQVKWIWKTYLKSRWIIMETI